MLTAWLARGGRQEHRELVVRRTRDQAIARDRRDALRRIRHQAIADDVAHRVDDVRQARQADHEQCRARRRTAFERAPIAASAAMRFGRPVTRSCPAWCRMRASRSRRACTMCENAPASWPNSSRRSCEGGMTVSSPSAMRRAAVGQALRPGATHCARSGTTPSGRRADRGRATPPTPSRPSDTVAARHRPSNRGRRPPARFVSNATRARPARRTRVLRRRSTPVA